MMDLFLRFNHHHWYPHRRLHRRPIRPQQRAVLPCMRTSLVFAFLCPLAPSPHMVREPPHPVPSTVRPRAADTRVSSGITFECDQETCKTLLWLQGSAQLDKTKGIRTRPKSPKEADGFSSRIRSLFLFMKNLRSRGQARVAAARNR